MYQYFVKIVPTVYKKLNGEVIDHMRLDGGQLESLCYFGHRAQFQYHNLKLFNVFIPNIHYA